MKLTQHVQTEQSISYILDQVHSYWQKATNHILHPSSQPTRGRKFQETKKDKEISFIHHCTTNRNNEKETIYATPFCIPFIVIYLRAQECIWMESSLSEITILQCSNETVCLYTNTTWPPSYITCQVRRIDLFLCLLTDLCRQTRREAGGVTAADDVHYTIVMVKWYDRD